MLFRVAFIALFSTAATLSNGFVPRQPSIGRGGSFPMSADNDTDTDTKEKVEGKKAGADAPDVNLGWDTHSAVVSGVVWTLLPNIRRDKTKLICLQRKQNKKRFIPSQKCI